MPLPYIYKTFIKRYFTFFTSNQTRTDKIYLEGRGYTDLTILVINAFLFSKAPRSE